MKAAYKPLIAGIMSLAAMTPCKAQKGVQLMSETGISGIVSKTPSIYGGMNFLMPKGRNFLDLYAGASVSTDTKKVSFVGLAIDNYRYNTNLSGWARETFVASKNTVSSTLEVAPVKASVSAGKFDFSLAPAYTLYTDVNHGCKCTQGLNTIFQTTYNISPKDKIFFEAKYMTEPSKNLFKTHFGNPKDNTFYMLSYMRILGKTNKKK